MTRKAGGPSSISAAVGSPDTLVQEVEKNLWWRVLQSGGIVDRISINTDVGKPPAVQ